MATRRKKKSSELDELLQMLGFLLRTEVQGIVLVLVSVFTLLSLFTNSRGSVTGAWIDLVRSLTGGRGRHAADFSHYADVPADLTQKLLVEKGKGNGAEKK